MTYEELEAINQRHEAWVESGDINVPLTAPEDITVLLKEVYRLRNFVQDVVGDHTHVWEAVDPQEVWACETCGQYSHDWAGSIQEEALNVLAQADEADE